MSWQPPPGGLKARATDRGPTRQRPLDEPRPGVHRAAVGHSGPALPLCRSYCTSSKILNIGRYMETTTTPTITPTMIIMSGSMIEVMAFSLAAISSS